MPTFFSLTQVTGRIEALLRPALEARFWVKAEISGGRERNGAFYCDLVESDDAGDVRAQLRCTIWRRELEGMRRRFREAGLELTLENGTIVGLECRVQFHPRYGLSLSGLDMDPAVALGELELRRRRILERLEKDGRLGRNATRPVSLLPARIGLIASRDSAAYRDLTQTLLQSGFGFTVLAVDTAVQGAEAEAGVLRAFDALERLADLDLILIVRGGGSKTDLAWLDNEAIARRIAACPVAVWTGIGHETDTSVLDAVAGQAFKTPTAVGEALVARFEAVAALAKRAESKLRLAWSERTSRARRNLRHATTGLRQGSRKLIDQRRSDLRARAEKLRGDVIARLAQGRERLQEARHEITTRAGRRLSTERGRTGAWIARLRGDVKRTLETAGRTRDALRERLRLERVLRRVEQEVAALGQRARALRAADPQTALARGFSLTWTARGRLIRSVADVCTDDATITRFADGSIESTVRKILKGGTMTETETSYEAKVERLEEILGRLDDSETPIDELAEDVKLGAKLIRELDARLKDVEAQVKDAFKELEAPAESEGEAEA